MQTNIANPEMQSRARCYAISLLIFSILCLDPFAILLAIFLIIASSCDYEGWEGWKTAALVFYIINLIAVIGCLIAFTITAFFFVYVAATYNALDPYNSSSYEAAAGILAFVFFLFLTFFIVQLTLSCKAYHACMSIFSQPAILMQVPMPMAYAAPAPYPSNPGYGAPQGYAAPGYQPQGR